MYKKLKERPSKYGSTSYDRMYMFNLSESYRGGRVLLKIARTYDKIVRKTTSDTRVRKLAIAFIFEEQVHLTPFENITDTVKTVFGGNASVGPGQLSVDTWSKEFGYSKWDLLLDSYKNVEATTKLVQGIVSLVDMELRHSHDTWITHATVGTYYNASHTTAENYFTDYGGRIANTVNHIEEAVVKLQALEDKFKQSYGLSKLEIKKLDLYAHQLSNNIVERNIQRRMLQKHRKRPPSLLSSTTRSYLPVSNYFGSTRAPFNPVNYTINPDDMVTPQDLEEFLLTPSPGLESWDLNQYNAIPNTTEYA